MKNKAQGVEIRREVMGGALVVAAAFIGTLIFAGMHNYVSEDAMFYLRYARNLAEGRGLVYNPGEYYENNTNFLWSVLLVPAFWLNIEPVYWFRFVGLTLALAAITATYIVARQAGTRRDAVFAAILLGFHSSFGAFAFVGFAPHMPSLFALAAAAFAFQMTKTARAVHAFAAGMCMFLLMISRLDGAVIAVPVGLFVLWAAWQNKERFARNFALCAILPGGLFAVYLFAKYSYYGDILPATYYAKADLPPQLKEWFNATSRAMKYTWLYVREYGFIFVAPLLLWGVLKAKPRRKKSKQSSAQKFLLLTCAAAVVLWFFYIVRIGGGYLEFRFWVTAAPFIFIIAARYMRELDFRLSVVAAGALIFASFWHAATYNKAVPPLDGVAYALDAFASNAQMTKAHYEERKKNFTALGDFFDEFGDYSEEVKFGTKQGGMGPFYMKSYTLELRGWTDTRIFAPGNHVWLLDPSPGHQRLASPKYLNERGIHFYFGDSYLHDHNHNVIAEEGAHNVVFKMSYPYGLMFPLSAEFLPQMPPDAKLVELPVGDKKIYAVYWTRSKKLDEFLARNNITLHDIYVR